MVFEFMANYAANINLLIIAFLQCAVIAWIYGTKNTWSCLSDYAYLQVQSKRQTLICHSGWINLGIRVLGHTGRCRTSSFPKGPFYDIYPCHKKLAKAIGSKSQSCI